MAPAPSGASGKSVPGSDAKARGRNGSQSSRGLTIGDYVAQLALRSGLTLEQAVEHSLPQLELLAKASRVITAENALIMLDVNYAAFAGVMAKNGSNIVKKAEKTLREQARP